MAGSLNIVWHEFAYCNFTDVSDVYFLPICSVQVGPKITGQFCEMHKFCYNDLGMQSTCRNVKLFIRSKNDILNAATLKCSLHKVRETTLH